MKGTIKLSERRKREREGKLRAIKNEAERQGTKESKRRSKLYLHCG